MMQPIEFSPDQLAEPGPSVSVVNYQQRLDRIGTVRGLRTFTTPERLALVSLTLLRYMAGLPGVKKLSSRELVWHWTRPRDDVIAT